MQNCYIDTGSFIIHIKIEDAYKDIANDIEKRFDTSNYEINKLLLKIKKLIVLMKDELGSKIWQNLFFLDEKHFLT